MSDMQYGLTLFVFGGGLTLASLCVIVLTIYIMTSLQAKPKKDA
ncbi:MAG: OadG-related small transporter subunit [Bacillota bacterium]